MKGATPEPRLPGCRRQNFNPRPREESDSDPIPWDDFWPISIHAPVKGATQATIQDLIDMLISIHAPVKGATCLSNVDQELLQISIHAPVKGAT